VPRKKPTPEDLDRGGSRRAPDRRGGRDRGHPLYKDDILVVDAQAVEGFASVNADLCLRGVWSIHAEVGVSQPSFEEVLGKRAMIRSADRVVALASAFVVAPVSAYTHLATERSIPDEILDPYRELGVEIERG
jgi:DeoR/GlpR family transcriptional regulator of sugar metabolism